MVGLTGWQDYTIADEAAASMQVIPAGVDPPLVLSVLGVTGMTAYFGMIDVGKVSEGDTVVVSGAAGATGSVAGQIARIKGATKVVGIAGSAEKCAWIVDELGFDTADQLQDRRRRRVLPRRCAPRGSTSTTTTWAVTSSTVCLAQLAMRGRIVLCGAISVYNEKSRPPGPRNIFNLIIKRGRMEGFLVLDYLDRFLEAQIDMVGWLAEGKVKHAEHLVDGLERAPDALNLLFTGGNTRQGDRQLLKGPGVGAQPRRRTSPSCHGVIVSRGPANRTRRGIAQRRRARDRPGSAACGTGSTSR